MPHRILPAGGILQISRPPKPSPTTPTPGTSTAFGARYGPRRPFPRPRLARKHSIRIASQTQLTPTHRHETTINQQAHSIPTTIFHNPAASRIYIAHLPCHTTKDQALTIKDQTCTVKHPPTTKRYALSPSGLLATSQSPRRPAITSGTAQTRARACWSRSRRENGPPSQNSPAINAQAGPRNGHGGPSTRPRWRRICFHLLSPPPKKPMRHPSRPIIQMQPLISCRALPSPWRSLTASTISPFERSQHQRR